MAYTNDAERWRALTIRDPNANGHFIYSVRSTKIYCRPICPGRLARRANVGFYATAFEAEAAGFRACKRCKPNTVLEDPQERAVEKACLLINQALGADNLKSLRLQDLAKKVNLTPRYFHKIFKDKIGLTPKEYATKKSTEHNSPSTTPASTTTTDASVPSWGWETFDFNDLIDFDAESSPILTDDLPLLQRQSSAIEATLNFEGYGLLQPWNKECDINGLDSGLFSLGDTLVDPCQAVLTNMSFPKEKAMADVSTFELDAAALFDCDSLTNLLQM